jgi:hypothetical protein
LDVIYERSDRMKLNIQTKIMHASIAMSPPPAAVPAQCPPATAEEAP